MQSMLTMIRHQLQGHYQKTVAALPCLLFIADNMCHAVKDFTISAPFRIPLTTAVGWLAVIHFFGMIGLLLPFSRPWFELATPLSLLTSALLLFYFHQYWNSYFAGFMILAFMAGFGIEVVGVRTGNIFGSYTYETTLGYKLLDVPLLIGVNWLMLSYACGVCFAPLRAPLPLKSLLAALLMTGMDYVIEPVAIIHHYWDWTQAVIPLQNYLAWFLVSFVLACIFYLLPFGKKNPLAKYLIVIQLLFFVLLQIGHHLFG